MVVKVVYMTGILLLTIESFLVISMSMDYRFGGRQSLWYSLL